MTHMKARLLLLLALLMLMSPATAEEATAVAPLCDPVPDAVLAHIDAWYPWARLLDCRTLPGGEYTFALIDRGDARELLGFRMEEGCLVNWLDSTTAIPQGDLTARLFYSLPGETYDVLCPGGEVRTVSSDGMNIGVYTTDGESMMAFVCYEYQGGEFLLTEYRRGRSVNVTGNELVFSDIGSGYEETVRCYLNRDIRFVDFAALPCMPDEARADPAKEPAPAPLPAEPPFEGYDPAFALIAGKAPFAPDERYDVYIGPGRQYGRSGGGKAAVSTNGWMQVFGQYDGWLLIQYGVNGERYRIGWITANALPEGTSVPELTFLEEEDLPWTLSAPWGLTDDPLCSRAELCTIPVDAGVTLLAWLGEEWAYVRVTVQGREWWGFLPQALLGHG